MVVSVMRVPLKLTAGPAADAAAPDRRLGQRVRRQRRPRSRQPRRCEADDQTSTRQPSHALSSSSLLGVLLFRCGKVEAFVLLLDIVTFRAICAWAIG